MTHSIADIVAKLLIDLALGTAPSSNGSWPIRSTSEPDKPDDHITVYETSGTVHGRLHFTGEMAEHLGIQIRVRSSLPPVGSAKVAEIAAALDTLVNRTAVEVSSSQYLVHSITRSGSVMALGKEPTARRNLFTINALVAVEQLEV